MKIILLILIPLFVTVGCQKIKESKNAPTKDISLKVTYSTTQRISHDSFNNTFSDELNNTFYLEITDQDNKSLKLSDGDSMSVYVNQKEEKFTEVVCNIMLSHDFCGYEVAHTPSAGNVELEIVLSRENNDKLISHATLPSLIKLMTPTIPFERITPNKQTVLISWQSEKPVTKILLLGGGEPCKPDESFRHEVTSIFYPAEFDSYYQTSLLTFGESEASCIFDNFFLNLISEQRIISSSASTFKKTDIYWLSKVEIDLLSQH